MSYTKPEPRHFQVPLPDAVKDHRSDYAIQLWEYITQPGKVENIFKETKQIGRDLGTSGRTVRKILKGFERCNLIRLVSYNGKKYGVKIINFWLQKAEKIKNKLSWKHGFEAENQYLKGLGRNQLDYLVNIEQSVTDKEHDFNKFKLQEKRIWLLNELGRKKEPNPGAELWDRLARTVRETIWAGQNYSTEQPDKVISDVIARSILQDIKKNLSAGRVRSYFAFLQNHLTDTLKACENVQQDGIKALYAMANFMISKYRKEMGWNGQHKFITANGHWDIYQNKFWNYSGTLKRLANPGNPPPGYWQNPPDGISKADWKKIRQNYKSAEPVQKNEIREFLPKSKKSGDALLTKAEARALRERINKRENAKKEKSEPKKYTNFVN